MVRLLSIGISGWWLKPLRIISIMVTRSKLESLLVVDRSVHRNSVPLHQFSVSIGCLVQFSSYSRVRKLSELRAPMMLASLMAAPYQKYFYCPHTSSLAKKLLSEAELALLQGLLLFLLPFDHNILVCSSQDGSFFPNVQGHCASTCVHQYLALQS